MLLPLNGIRVLDLTRVLAGPFCTMLLADLGAEVIKVEKPIFGDDTRQWGPPFVQIDNKKESVYFLSVNRNKKSITLDMKNSEGYEIVKKLVQKSDVLVENFLPGKLKSMKLDYDSLKEINKSLIYCSISGYGQDGPYSKRGGYDVIASAMFGLMNITGEPTGPPVKSGVAVTDIATGLYCHGAIMAALIQRIKTGMGQKIDACLLNTQISVLSHVAANYLNANLIGTRQGTAHGSIVPYQAFESKDKKYFVIGAGNDQQFKNLLKLMELDENLSTDSKYSSNSARVQNRTELIDLLQKKFIEKNLSEWVSIFSKSSIPMGPINNMKEVFEDEQVIHNKIVQSFKYPNDTSANIKVPGPAVNYSEFSNDATLRHAPPSLGQHTNEILLELGYNQSQIQELHSKKAI